MTSHRRTPWVSNAVLLFAAAAMTGCAGSSPFSSASSVDLNYISAAQTWDLDKDNIVTCAEWKQYTSEFFRDSDADKDGFVTQEEYKSIVAQDRLFETIGFSHFDSNGDSKLTLQEFSEKPNPAFALLDKNKDCQIDGNEIVQRRPDGPKPKEQDPDQSIPRR